MRVLGLIPDKNRERRKLNKPSQHKTYLTVFVYTNNEVVAYTVLGVLLIKRKARRNRRVGTKPYSRLPSSSRAITKIYS